MSDLTLRILGCGDAFASGARLQTCFHLKTPDAQVLIDCGASALIGMQQAGLDPSAIDGILITHLHGDHFGGVPFLLLQQHYVARRTRPLTIAGPAGTEMRMRAALAVLFPGSENLHWRFPLTFIELGPKAPNSLLGLVIHAFEMIHPSGAPSLGYRIATHGRILAVSGDTAWADALLPLAQDADLFICECYADKPGVRHHLDYETLKSHWHELGPRRMLLTHLSESALAARSSFAAEVAEDGLVIDL